MVYKEHQVWRDEVGLDSGIFDLCDVIEDQAELVILKIVHNLKFKEIAEYKGMTIGKVQSDYYDAIKTLRKELK